MSDRDSAEENLRVIRSLLERVTTYRAISPPSAVVAGLLSTVAAGAVYYNNEVSLVLGGTVRPREFAIVWIIVLPLAGLANAFFLQREARSGGGPFFFFRVGAPFTPPLSSLLFPASV